MFGVFFYRVGWDGRDENAPAVAYLAAFSVGRWGGGGGGRALAAIGGIVFVFCAEGKTLAS